MPLEFLDAERDRKLASGEYVEVVLACGHEVTYDARNDNPQVRDLRTCFQCRRRSQVVHRINHKAG